MNFKRQIFDEEQSQQLCEQLQSSLATLIDLGLSLKQAHWNVVGENFRSLHLQLDEILASTREATDEIAERIVTLGWAPDGRAETIANSSRLASFPSGLHRVPEMVSQVADRLMTGVQQLREAISEVSQIDPISEDMLISIAAQQEKHLWMLQAQEVESLMAVASA